MPIEHVVAEGDHLTRIAEQHGFGDIHAIWDHPLNAELKGLRGNPNVLFPGDLLTIPDRSPRVENRATGQVHRFIRHHPTLLLRIALAGPDGLPLAALKVTLQIEGETISLVTNSDGVIERSIPPTAQNGKLTIEESRIEAPIAIGFLHPVEEMSGWRARLNNLGYGAGGADDPDDPIPRSAVEEFQCDQGLAVTGEMDATTRSKLRQVHGC